MEENRSLLPPGGAPGAARCCPAFIALCLNIVLTYEKQTFAPVLNLSIVLCDVSVVFPACNCLMFSICCTGIKSRVVLIFIWNQSVLLLLKLMNK